jgi:hypothetical protein
MLLLEMRRVSTFTRAHRVFLGPEPHWIYHPRVTFVDEAELLVSHFGTTRNTIVPT